MKRRFRLTRRSGARLLRCDAVLGCSHAHDLSLDMHLAEGTRSSFVCCRADEWAGVKGAFVIESRALEKIPQRDRR